MTEKVRNGQYVVGERGSPRRRDPPELFGVVKGDVVNQNNGEFGSHMGVSKSKWYVYKNVEHLRQYHDRSGTGVLNVVSLVEEFDTKGEAVDCAERMLEL